MNEASDYVVMPPMWPMPDKVRKVDQVDQALRETMRLLLDGKKPWPLFLHGEPGSGKTCALMCLIDQCGSGIYVTLRDLREAFIDARQKKTAFYDLGGGIYRSGGELWRDWGNGNVCGLDEVAEGCDGKMSEHHYATLKQALDRREHLPLAVVSNLDIKGIEAAYGDPIASRLASGTIVHTSGDRRLTKGAKSAEVTG